MAENHEEQQHILIADDDDAVRSMLHDLLTDEGYQVTEVRSGTEVLTRIASGSNGYGLLLMDVRMPGIDGLEVLERLHKNNSDLGVIMITGHATSSAAIRATQMGAYDYITKPFEVDEVLLTIRRFFEHQELSQKYREIGQQSSDPRDRMVGSGAAMQRVYKQIGRVAASDATVLVTGETGTGKELVANVIHANSPRRAGPLIKVNCAALTDTLLESELFGHEKGAFTSAVSQRKGRFELANKGTIFLDEVGELSLAAQKKLLRVLQEGEFERVGGTATLKVDVRVITATNRDLEEEVRKGNFREDLFYRLNVINIHMPPLRERKDDILLLVEHFLDRYRYMPSSPPTRISEEAIQKMLEYDWPGNVRQLENEIQRAVVYSQGKVITSELLSLEPGRQVLIFDLANAVRERRTLGDVLRDVEQTMLDEALRQESGDHSAAAERLGLARRDFDARLKAFDRS